MWNSAQSGVPQQKGIYMVLRRMGQDDRQMCMSGHNCPQILADEVGDFVVVGSDVRDEAIQAMPKGPGVGPTEGAVKVPRAVVVAALPDILASLH